LERIQENSCLQGQIPSQGRWPGKSWVDPKSERGAIVTVRVEALSEADYERVLPLIAGYQRFYRAEPDEDRNRAFFRRFLAPSEDGLLLGAWKGDEIVGFATLYWTFTSTHAAEAALMNDLFVADGHRGEGVGLALIEASVAAARDRGMRHLEWFTALDNERAQRLYDRTAAQRSGWYNYEIPTE
jgi:GNAT superfamily N-acetyltransferase